MSNEFEKWIESSAPAVEVNESMKDVHLAILKQRLRERDKQYKTRQKRTRRGSIVAVALMLVLVGGNVSELGSDGFEFVVTESEFAEDSQSLEIGFRKAGITGPGSMDSETLRDLQVEMERTDGVIDYIEGLGIQGSETWSLVSEYYVNGTVVSGGTSLFIPGRPYKLTMAHLEFSKSEMDLMLENIEKGDLLPASSRIQTVENTQFLIKEYHFQSNEFGLVVYQKGLPIR